jgi:hypothetical protein
MRDGDQRENAGDRSKGSEPRGARRAHDLGVKGIARTRGTAIKAAIWPLTVAHD